MDADRLDRSRSVAVGMLHGVRVDDELVEGHASRVRVLDREQVAVRDPSAAGRRSLASSGILGRCE